MQNLGLVKDDEGLDLTFKFILSCVFDKHWRRQKDLIGF